MSLLLVLDHKFHVSGDGSVWAHTMFGPVFFRRYLEVFDEVRVVSRLRPCMVPPAGAQRVDGPQVSFSRPVYFEGIRQFFEVRREVKTILQKEIAGSSAIILRLYQFIPGVAADICRRRGIPFGAEIVGDPWDTFSPGASLHPLRPFIRLYLAVRLRQLCARAEATSYVTESALQRRYPPAPGRFTTHASSIELLATVDTPRPEAGFRGAKRLLFVGGLGHLYKGQDTLIRALALLVEEGVDCHLVIVGDGKHRGMLERLGRDLGVDHRLEFRGTLAAGSAVMAEMDAADLFVLPSRQEGLPRAAIEAMSRGLPVVLTDVGGNSELVPREELVASNDVVGLKQAISQKLANPRSLAVESERNLRRARDYLDNQIQPRRVAFYSHVAGLQKTGGK